MNAVAVILAAGAPRRLEHPKALLQHDSGKSFLQSLASSFGKAGCRVLGVVGSGAEQVRAQHPTLQLIDAERWSEGVMASVHAGLRAALEEGAELLLLHPVDMPAVRASTLKSLLKKAEAGTGLRPEFEGAQGFPVVLTRAEAERLLEVQAATLEAALGTLELRRVPVKDPGVVVNINTPEIYERLFGAQPQLAPPPKRRRKSEPPPEHVE